MNIGPCWRYLLRTSGTLLIPFLLVIALPAAALDTGATGCVCKDCHITITISVVFVGADQDYINRFSDEVRDTWNGPPDNPSTYGDCMCPFEVKVITKKADKCDSPQKENHCIEVTNYTANPPYSGNESVIGQVKNGTIDPRTSNQVTRYRGYLKPPGTSTGLPLTGWWSDAMSSSYNGTSISDFAHETGHLMGLVDSSGGIMDFSGMTSGRVSQGNIDQAVQNVCGKDACPDRCCCGNAKVDTAKGEGCDPLAAPSGCVTGTSCCPVCCKCQVPSCDPLSGEYPSEEDCKKNCKGERETCHINYHTGCWDCAHQLVIESNREYQSTRETIWKANESTFHPPGPKPANTTQLAALLSSVTDRPVVSDFLANERISVHFKEGEYYITTKDGGITEFGEGPGTDPTVNVWSDEQTLRQIADGNLRFEDAVSSGRVRFEGVGFVSFIKFAVSELLVKFKSALDIGG